jgi:hypothetical protein
MKLNGSVLVVVAMMVGSLGAIGCKSSDQSAQSEANPAEQPAAEPVKDEVAKTDTATAKTTTDESFNVQAKTTVRIGEDRPAPRYVPTAPPAPRFERRGRAPSTRHFWVNGYHKFANGRYIWIGGHWDTQRGNMIYVQPHYDRVDGHWRYIPGHWVRK